MDGAASDDEEISALGASPARPRAGGSAASSPTLSLPESFSNLGGEPAPLARQLESELAATHERRAAEREAYHARRAAARRDAAAVDPPVRTAPQNGPNGSCLLWKRGCPDVLNL